MGHYEDIFWDINKDITERGLKDEFFKTISKIQTTEKGRYMEFRDIWRIAHYEVIYKTKIDGK